MKISNRCRGKRRDDGLRPQKKWQKPRQKLANYARAV
jgi:hypothetical protein